MALVPFPGSAQPAPDDDDRHIQLTDPDPPTPSTLRTAARNYQRALDQLTEEAGLAA